MLAGLIFTTAFPSCTNVTEQVSIAALVVEPDSVVLVRGDSQRLTVSAVDGQNRLITGVAVVFRSTDTSIATVSNLGLVRSKGPVGTTTITVSGGGASTDVPVRVFAQPAAILVSPSDTSIRQSASFQLRAVAVDSGGDTIPNLTLSYQTTDATILTVSPTGVVTSTGSIGTAGVFVSRAPLQTAVTVRVIDSSIVASLPLSGSPSGVAISSAGVAYVTRTGAGRVERLDLTAKAFTASIPVGSVPTQVTFNAAGTTAYVSNQGSQSLSVVNVAANTQVDLISTVGDPVPMRVLAGGQYLFVTTNANKLYKIDLATKAAVDSLSLPATSHQLLLHPNDSLLYVATRDGGTVMEVNVSTMAVARTFTLGGVTQGLAMSPNRQELYVANEVGKIHVVNLTSGTAVDSVAMGGGVFGLALGPDGTKLFASLLFDGQVEVVDRASRTVVRTVTVGGSPRHIAVDPGRQLVVVANESGWVDIMR